VKVDWDYTHLAAAYRHRPPYAPAAIDAIVATTGIGPGDPVCDVGAGTGHLSVEWLARGLRVTAVEPNDAMRAEGEGRTGESADIHWHAAAAEDTGQPANRFRLVSFGSSFNVVRQAEALTEAHRVLRNDGWFSCLWNHRDLDDPLQAAIEDLIHRAIPTYAYGARREDPTAVIEASGLFDSPERLEAPVTHIMPVAQFAEGWRSHATLQRQAGDRFEALVDSIGQLLTREAGRDITVPYVTRVWVARRR
jgi:SAM-dependent methyltransferase